MPKTNDAVSTFAAGSVAANETRSRWIAIGRDGVRDVVAGVVAAVVLIANIVSFGALMFPGDFSAGIPVVVWSMLIGACICGVWIALATSLPPIATGIDSPTGTVLVLLSALAGARVVAAGGSPQAAVQIVMLLFTTATFLSGALLYLLGACRWSAYFRFVPFSVVGGFLAATGCFLVAGGVRMITARSFSVHALAAPWTFGDVAKLGTAVLVVAVLLALRFWVKWALAMPAALLAMWLGLVAALRSLGLSGTQDGWYFHSLGALKAWTPFTALDASSLTWPTVGHLIPELFAVLFVALISLITKVSSIEISRQASGDLDRELRAHGAASMIAAPFGGLASSVQVGTSRLLEHVGATRMSGVACAATMGIVGIAHFDLPGIIPIPLVGGLIFYLGYSFIADAVWRPYSQRAWVDLALIVGITIVCLQYGYLVGVLAGLVCACMLFAISYARLGVIRRHATRAQVVSHVDRSVEASDYLRKGGDAIQLYWLSGYIFFGSSEGIFERIKADINALHPQRIAYLLLDFSLVSGADTSAIVSLSKLRRFCKEKGATLVFCSLSAANRAALEQGGFLDRKNPQQVFSDFNSALGWCEDQMLGKAKLEADVSLDAFEAWLQCQLGSGSQSADLTAYLERKNVDGGQVIYRQGDPAETIDLIAEGRLNVEVTGSDGMRVRVRRMATHTVVGEMGFFRKAVRSASISSDSPAVVFTLTRANFDRMRRERPDLAGDFIEFIVRVLADRIESANREIAALIP
ncbi:MAG: SulP family inorganic anion transporter [Xanthobacteraceae bacterium]